VTGARSSGDAAETSVAGEAGAVRRTVRLLGLDYADMDAAEAAAALAARPADAPFAYVVTPNADHISRLSRRPELAPLYGGAWLRLLDSRVVRRAARLLGLAAPRVCTGADLTALLLARTLQPGDAVTVIGASSAELARLGLARAAHHAPPRGFERDPAELARAVRFVVEHPARYVFLAVGSPRQEILAAAVARTGRATGTGLCVGAALAFAAGSQARAPAWMRARGLEWLHRLGQEPRRLSRRYLVDSPPVFLGLLKARAVAAKRREHLAPQPDG
jgi:exopolysaccharide biosynthesis WecB/TagA/CpsF family protein